MNAANVGTSPRLQRVLRALAAGEKLSTLQIIERAQVCAVNSCIAELRANGHPIECERAGGIWRYWHAAPGAISL